MDVDIIVKPDLRWTDLVRVPSRRSRQSTKGFARDRARDRAGDES
jgi:hypothetical protein